MRESNPYTASPVIPGRRRRVARASPPRRSTSNLRAPADASPRRRSRSRDDSRPTTRKEDPPAAKAVKRPAAGSPLSRNILARKSLQGERAGITWTIVFDTPFSHGKERMNIVTGIESLNEEIATAVPVDSTKDVIMKDNALQPAMPERIIKRNETSPTKRRSSGEKVDRNNGTALRSGENSGMSNKLEKATQRRTSGETGQTELGALPRRTSGEKNNPSNSKTETAAPRRISGEKNNVGNIKSETTAPRRSSGEKNNLGKSKTETAAPRRTSGEKDNLKISNSESNTPRQTSSDKNREQGATPRRTSGEKNHPNESSKSDSVTPRRVSGEKKNKDHSIKQPLKGPSDSTDRYFTRSHSDSERSADDDNSIGNVQLTSTVFSNSDDFSIDPLANFLPRAIDDSIHRRTLGSAQVSLADSRISEDSGLEVRPTRRGRRNHANKPPPTTSRSHKARVSPRSKRSYLNRSGSTDVSALDYGASRKSLSSASDTSSHDTNAVAATFMQFTLNEKGFVQELSKDHNVESESTLRLARAVAESDVPHLPVYDLGESAAINFEESDAGNLEHEDDATDQDRQVRPEHGIKSRFSQIGRKLRDVQRSFSSDGVELMLKSDTRKKRSFFTAAHASFMRSSSSGGGIFGLCDEPSSENNGDDVMLEN
ncbi:hypothetical protein FisN_8Lh193 [Fistulifera solaris]|uniref:Uncharacterized protein n=1 Tax=Fistulifera solaris TaxID=1519565 RepID=A0A1Z5JNG4_FISSO|nr:hypothetical protein FisN_8Lh193 [Fistulifera solaris]|eukprot:GAX15509.1 hypothetical protein FisN_8Lh193 [Fistulifera solaris]